MSVLAEVEEKAMSLTTKERGRLAAKLLASLPNPFEDEDEDIVALALERDKEMDEHPETVMSEEEFWGSLEEFRQR